MSIRFPNAFSCTGRSVLFDETDPVDFRALAGPGVPAELIERLVARRFVVTTSQVESTTSEQHSIRFAETIVKVPVHWGGEDFLFPVVTFVDNEHSLIRGYLLGFHKVFAAPEAGTDGLVLQVGDLALDLRAEPSPADWASPDIPPEHGYPFLLWTDYSLAPGVSSHGYRRLTAESYARHSVSAMRPAHPEQRIAGRQVTARMMYEIRDSFVLTGSVPAQVEAHA